MELTSTSPAKPATDLVITQLNRELSENPTPIQAIHTPMRSFAAFEWSRSIVEQLGVRKLNLLLARLRHSAADRSILREAVGCIRAPLIALQNTAPERYVQWQSVLSRSSLHRHGGTLGWPETFRALAVRGIQNPPELITLSYDQHQRLLPPNLAASTTLLWQGARSMGQTTVAGAAHLHLMAEPVRLVKAIRAVSVEESILEGA